MLASGQENTWVFQGLVSQAGAISFKFGMFSSTVYEGIKFGRSRHYSFQVMIG